MRQRLVIVGGRNNVFTGRLTPTCAPRAFWPTGISPCLDESVFAGGQLSDPAIQQTLVRPHGCCAFVELNSYATERCELNVGFDAGVGGSSKQLKKLGDTHPSSDKSLEES
jgi:hypothetical protein